MYIKKKDKILFEELDKNLKMPSNWNRFIDQRVKKNKLVIKSKDGLYCTNCGNHFDRKVKVNDICRCPKCRNVYTVKSSRIRQYHIDDDLALLQKYNNYYILRQFRLVTYMDGNNFIFKNYSFEYARVLYDLEFNEVMKIVNENVVGSLWGMIVVNRELNSTSWRYFQGYNSYLPDYFIYYHYNLKKILSEVKNLKYSQLWTLAAKLDYFDIIYLIKNYNNSIEYLVKMKLYKLALCPRNFKNKRTFEERFEGLTKDYLPFIRKYNLNIDELKALSYIKTKNINYLRRYKDVSSEVFRNLKHERVNFISLIKKTNFSSENEQEYLDYLDMAKLLGLNLKDKKNLYPKNITVAHDRLVNDYKIQKNEVINLAIVKRAKKLEKYKFQDKKYIIYPASDYDSLIDESSQQNNCVRTYAEKYAKGKCDIFFMRLNSDKNHSLVTVEVQNKKVVQKRIKNNGITTKSQNHFLNLWEQVVLQK